MRLILSTSDYLHIKLSKGEKNLDIFDNQNSDPNLEIKYKSIESQYHKYITRLLKWFKLL